MGNVAGCANEIRVTAVSPQDKPASSLTDHFIKTVVDILGIICKRTDLT
jgi:hypothetical protein